MSSETWKMEGEKAASTLRTWATVISIINLIAAIVVGVQFGVQQDPRYVYLDKMIPNPVGIGVAVALLLSGILIYSVLNAIATMAEDIAAVRKKLAV